jgi:SAM-dependent methyltransferase
MRALYDRIGRSYAAIRQPDSRLAEPIWDALGDAESVLNVGAGAGAYEPPDRDVVAVEPSSVMIAQRPRGSARAIQASAENLPFPDGSFDAAMALFTVHHWTDVAKGLAELVRVARDRVVLVAFDPERARDHWIISDYLPEWTVYCEPSLPSIARLLAGLPRAEVCPLPVPRDCTDRMLATLWARPEQYLDPQVRAATSAWHQVPATAAERALRELSEDLASGRWDERHGHLRATPEADMGIRLIGADLPPFTPPGAPRERK